MPGLFGKRIGESSGRGESTPGSRKAPLRLSKLENCAVSYSTFENRDVPSLLYLKVRICGCEILALVDSGSSRTFLGPKVLELLGNSVSFSATGGRRVTTATGQVAKIRAQVDLPCTVQDRTKTVRVFALSALALPCILGMDFLATFGIIVDFASRSWRFADSLSRKFGFDVPETEPLCYLLESGVRNILERKNRAEDLIPKNNKVAIVKLTKTAELNGGLDSPEKKARKTKSREKSDQVRPPNSTFCCGLSELSSNEARRLEKFLETELGPPTDRPGITTLTEHKIDVGNNAPIKQRYYIVSPKMPRGN